MRQGIPLAFRQLTFERMKLLAAIGGVMVAVMLMWIQLGILASLYDSGTVVHRHIKADLLVLHPLSDTLARMKLISVRTLYRVKSHPDVAQVGELVCSPVEWKHPETGKSWQIQAWGMDAEEDWLDLPGFREHKIALREPETFLFDQGSKAVFGPVVETHQAGKPLTVELNRRTCRLVGMTSLGASFGQMGNLVTNRANFLRLNAQQVPEQVHLGFIRLANGADRDLVRSSLNTLLEGEAIVMTPQEFVDLELMFFKTNAPVGFIFTTGTIIGFLIGFIVVYQILYSDVANNLRYYATMKAMGFSNRWLFWLIMRQGMTLSILGYVFGSLLAISFYKIIQAGTAIPVSATWSRAWTLLWLTFLMCFLSSLMATRKLRSADPADVF